MRTRQYRVKLIALITLVAIMFSLMPANMYAADYGDMKGHWAEAQISSWIEQGLASGYSDNMFRPDQAVTRAEFAAFIHRAFNLPKSDESSAFRDVSGSDWYYAYVSDGVKAGLFSGYPDGSFKPNDPVTRQEIAVIINRLLGLEVPAVELAFTDKEKIPAWALDAVTAVYGAGIVSGYPDQTFRPEQAVTRAESIVVLDRALDVKASPAQVVPTGKYKITFSAEAKDANGKSIPAAGVSVQLYSDQERKNKIGDSFMTDSAGTAALELASATYYFTATLTGYEPKNGSFEVKEAAALIPIDMGAKKKTGSSGGSASSDVTEVTIGTGGEAELTAVLQNKNIKTIYITGEISGDFTVSLDGQTIDGEGSILSRNKLTGNLTVTAAGAEVKNLLIQGDLSVSGSSNSISNLNVRGDVLLQGNSNHLTGITVVGYYTDNGVGNILDGSNVTSHSPGGDVVLAGEDAQLNNTTIKNQLIISGNGNSVTDGSAGSAEVAGSGNGIFRTGVRGEIHLTGNHNQIVDSPAKGGYRDSGQENSNDYTKINFDLPKTVYMSVYETKSIVPEVFFPSGNYGISAVSGDETVATVTVSNAAGKNTKATVQAEVYGSPQLSMENELTYNAAETVYAEVYGERSGTALVDITVSAEDYESVTKTVKVFVDVPVTGWVWGIEPISGASLTFYDTDGNVISETGPVTTKQGSFFTVIKDLPSDFRVVAHGGTNAASGTPFTDALIADCRDFDPEEDIIDINIGSSIVSAYLDETPGISIEEAEENINRFFELPEWLDLFSAFENFSDDDYLDIEAFLAEAEENGGLEQYIAQLAQELPSGSTHPFGKVKLQSVVASIGMNIAGAVAEKAIGWGLQKAGIGFEATTGTQLAAIQNQLIDIKKDLKAMDNKMEYLYGELSRQINETGYDIRVGQLNSLMSSIRSITDDLAVLVTMTENDSATRNARELLRRSIIRRIENDIINNSYTINNQLMGTVGQESLLKVWSKVIKGRHKFLSSRDSDTIKEQFEYFSAVQACMMLLQVEYYNDRGASASADNAYQAYRRNIEAQSNLLKDPIPDTILIDRDQNLMIYEGEYFDWESGGKTYKTKAPLHLKYWEAGDKVKEWNSTSFMEHNNWRLLTRTEIANFCTYRGNLIPRKYLENQGWASPMPDRMYFGTQYSSHSGDLPYSHEGVSFGNADTEYFQYQVFELDNGVWHDQMTEYFIPGQYMAVYRYGRVISTYTVGGRDSVSIPVYHWPVARDMDASELDNYFW